MSGVAVEVPPRLRSGRPESLLVLLVLSGCFIPREPAPVDRSCARCHGDATRPGDRNTRGAPPFDTFSNTDVIFPGVGAHELHLTASLTHGPVACAECHRVPTTLADEGHNDGRTTFSFGPIARGDAGVEPAYDFGARRCTTACHGGTSGVWTRPRSSSDACGSCHGLPPPLPHPQVGACANCHGEVVALDGGFVNAALHVDGVIQLAATCDSCHGDDPSGAPPRALDGSTARSSPGVGAHELHLTGGTQTRPVSCATCHEVPLTVATAKHPNGGRAEVNVMTGWSTGTSTCATACHGPSSPAWTSTAGLDCAGCHGAPPAAPHPQVQSCAMCHPNATGALGRQMIDRTRHVDGVVDVLQPSACDSCHGTAGNAAPPRDTRGETATTSPGVGAHQAHVVGRGLARVVLCSECHVVPTTVSGGQHLDGVAQVTFSGVARANLASPVYSGGSCGSTACHDISNYTVAPGGGQATTPRWTQVDGTQATCTSCHGMPPPLPHVQRSDCEGCHLNATALRTFVRPELHVNGNVEFALP